MKFLDRLDEVPRSKLEARVQGAFMVLIFLVLAGTVMLVTMGNAYAGDHGPKPVDPPLPRPVVEIGPTSTTATGGQANALASASVAQIEPRQVPGLGQGSFAIEGCNVGGNAGGADAGSSGFIGFAFPTKQCNDFRLAQAYQALGAYAAACEVLNHSPAGRRAAKRGVALPVCAAPIAVSPLPVVVNVEAAKPDCHLNADKPDCKAEIEHAFKSMQSK